MLAFRSYTKSSLSTHVAPDAVILALKERLQRSLIHRLDQIALGCAARPILDRRIADEICSYDASGLPS